jgi:hypothetical protein
MWLGLDPAEDHAVPEPPPDRRYKCSYMRQHGPGVDRQPSVERYIRDGRHVRTEFERPSPP